ncbi:hypothetical protein OAU50_05810 [Planctomycetota bacterium]|nr:hypothetical protein [Planctomycetota bacterium]
MIGYYPINPDGQSQEDAFGPVFFRSQFMDRIKKAYNPEAETPIIELMLTNGQVLDVSCIVELKPDYVLLEAFIDDHDPERTFRTFIRYQTIFRINVLRQPKNDRPIGFQVGHEPDDHTRVDLTAKDVKAKKS